MRHPFRQPIRLRYLIWAIDVGAQALQRWKRVNCEEFSESSPCTFEIKIEDFEAKDFFRSEVIGDRSLRYLRRFYYVVDTRASKPALVHDAKPLGQYLCAVRRLTHGFNMYVRIRIVKKPCIRLLPLML